MPVFSRVRDGVLILTVDGDYTANELHRVGGAAFEAEDAPGKLPVLLDLSGAAGLAHKSPGELATTGAIFGAYRDRCPKRLRVGGRRPRRGLWLARRGA